MKAELFSTEANKIWRRVASEAVPDMPQVQLDLYKKLLNFFQVGDYYYYIFNLKTLEFDFVSNGIETLLGYKPSEVTLALMIDKMHPDDRPWFLSFENKTAQFLAALPTDKLTKYKVRYDMRFKKSDGEYVRVLHQVVVTEIDEYGAISRTLGVHTDITTLKKEGVPVMSLIGMDGEPSYINIDVKNSFVETPSPLTKREKQVLIWLIEGKQSKEIAEILNASKQTIDTHRKNMLRKNNLNSTGELISKAIKQGWV